MRPALARAVLRVRLAWASDTVRLVVLTVYYAAIIVGIVALRGAHLPPTRFVYQEF